MYNFSSLKSLIKKKYEKDYIDYWMPPLVSSKDDEIIGRVKSNDGIMFCCRRGEREVQLTEAFVESEFEHFEREDLKNLEFIPLTHYHDKFNYLTPVFKSETPKKTLVEELSKANIKQIRITESEKKPHVTYFLNGKNNISPPDTDLKIVPTRKEGREEKPGEETNKITDLILESMKKDKYGAIFVNYSAGDIMGHINNWKANVKEIEAIDQGLGRILAKANKFNYTIMITADHGLLEKFWNKDGSFNSSHTTANVPFILINEEYKEKINSLKKTGTLADLAPTILNLMDLKIPEEMTGEILTKEELNKINKFLLIILDGWGIGDKNPETNPIIAAETPNYDYLINNYPNTILTPYGSAVGLPENRKGNSEAGHLTITSGKPIKQDELIIEEAIQNKEIKNNKILKDLFFSLVKKQSNLHLFVLFSELSSHGNFNEGFQIAQAAADWELNNIFLHLILDGRSSPQQGTIDLLNKYESAINSIKNMKLVSVIGRGYALDRDGDYTGKTKIIYDAFVKGVGDKF